MAIDPTISPLQAANAYTSVQKAAEGADPSAAAAGGASFSDLIKEGIKSAVDTIKGADRASVSAMTGKADLNDVVQSVTKAELTLQTIVAVRDRLITAYQEILRMPI